MTGNSDFFKMVERMIRAAGKRAGQADEHELKLMNNLKKTVEENIKKAIHSQLELGKSWNDIGLALGTSRQAAFKKYS